MIEPSSGPPFKLVDGWPQRLLGTHVSAIEAGVLLGDVLLEQSDWEVLRASVVFSLRIDAHPLMDGWITEQADGTNSRVAFAVPTEPVPVPMAALGNSRSFGEWVQATHGGLGRLLMWDSAQRWWMTNEPELEVTVLCAPPGTFASADADIEPFIWLRAVLTAVGVDRVRAVCARYDLPSSTRS